MSGMRLLALGVGNAFSSRYYSSCFALEAEGQWLLIDCPHPIRKVVREASQAAGLSLKIDDVLAVVLTHLHADHASGMEGLLFFYRYVLKTRPTLIAHSEGPDKLWPGPQSASMKSTIEDAGQPPMEHKPEEFYQWMPLGLEKPVQIGPFSIAARMTLHNIPTTALRI